MGLSTWILWIEGDSSSIRETTHGVHNDNTWLITRAKTVDLIQASCSSSVLSLLSLSHVRLLATPWTTARRAPLTFTISLTLLKLMSSESVMPSNHLILCHPLLLLPLILPSIRVFSNEQALCIR